jgi:hypothetical protein
VAAIITAGAVGVITPRPLWVHLLGAASLVTWIGTAWLYLRSVIGIKAVAIAIDDWQSGLQRLQHDANHQLEMAFVATGVALAFTAATLLGAFFSPKETYFTKATIVLTARGGHTVAQVCGGPIRTVIAGKVMTSGVDDAYLTIEPATSTCSGSPVVRLLRSEVLGLRTSEP